jgi:Dolichyl-phosphate-mannose-protein mannosyltransferase/Domain of unknown function DUF11
MTVPRLRLVHIAIAAGFAIFFLAGWQGVTGPGRSGGVDAAEYLLNAQYLDAHGGLPPHYISYEYSAPPLFELAAVGVEHTVRWLPSAAIETGSNAATRLAWLLLVCGSVALMTSARAGVRVAGLAGLGLGLLWGLDEAISLGKTEAWSAGQLLSLTFAAGLVVVSGLIARELWPGHPGRALATAAFVAAYPVVLRIGMLFHPETAMAFLSALAVWLLLRAEKRGWPLRHGVAIGVLCGLDIWTRQSAVVVCAVVLVAAVLAGRRRAVRFLAATAVALALVGGPWLGYAAYEWGNPLQGNLNRPGDMIAGGEPASFYVNFPIRSLVVHPYRPRFANELLPMLHADLWSDWYGTLYLGTTPRTRVDRVSASSQSVLGLVADALALGGLAGIGVPAFLRLARRRPGRPSDFAFGTLALLAVAGFLSLVAQIARYPQIGGVEVKASYLLFAAPAFALFSVAAWLALVRRRAALGIALAGVAVLYVASYATSLASAFSHTFNQQPQLVEPSGYYDLLTSIQQLTPSPTAGNEADFAIFVQNTGTATAGDVMLTIRLFPGMTLVGPPFHERGPGCTGSGPIVCDLDFLPAGESTPVRFGVKLAQYPRQGLNATASAYGLDRNPANNVAAITFPVGQ